MARFTVVWPLELDDRYVDLWLQSDSAQRRLLTQVSHLIHRWLAWNPADLGEPVSLEPNLRIWLLPEVDRPVSVLYRVSELDRLVTVVRVILHQK